MQWHQADQGVKDAKRANPLLTAFQYKKPLRHSRHRSGLDGIETTPAASGLVDQIHRLSDRLRTELAPQFDQLENDLDKYVVQVRQKVDQMDDLQNQVRSAVAAFTTQVKTTEEEMGSNLNRLRKWMEEPRDISKLKTRLEVAHSRLQKDSGRLELLNKDIAGQVAERQKNERNEVVRYRLLLFSILIAHVAILGYYLLK